MRRYAILFLLTIFSATLFAQDKTISEKIGNITKINIDGDVTVNLIKGKENRLQGVVPENQIENFTWSVIDANTLVITVKKPLNLGNNPPLSPISCDIYYTNINDIKCKRGGRVISDDTIDTRELGVDVSRNSVVSISVKCFDLSAHCSSGSVLTVKGECEYAVLNCSYGGSIQNFDLQTVFTTVIATTDSDAEVQASKRLLLYAKTNARVKYKKTDAMVSKFESLLGKIVEDEPQTTTQDVDIDNKNQTKTDSKLETKQSSPTNR